MSAFPYMPLYVADYLADAAHLSTLEHGAYLLLIMTYWQRGKALPADSQKLARIARVTESEWQSISGNLAEFFSDDGETWSHKRIDAELAKVADKSEKAKEAGKASVKARKATPVQRTLNERSTDAEQTLNDTDTDTDTEREREVARATDPEHWKVSQDIIKDHSQAVDEWELDFLHSIKWKPELTKPQRDSLKAIQGKLSSKANPSAPLPSVKRGTPAYDAWISYYRKKGRATFFERQDAFTVPSELPPMENAA